MGDFDEFLGVRTSGEWVLGDEDQRWGICIWV